MYSYFKGGLDVAEALLLHPNPNPNPDPNPNPNPNPNPSPNPDPNPNPTPNQVARERCSKEADALPALVGAAT